MAQRQITKKEIAKDARQLFKEGGHTKQEVFDLLVDKYKYSKDVADVLKYIPSTQAIAKYGIWNTVLLVLLILTVIIFFLVAPSIGTFLWYGLLIYAIAMKLVKFYMWITVLSTFSLIAFIVIIIVSSGETFYWTRTIIMMLLIIPSCFLPVWLEKKLCPKLTERKEEYTNDEGEQRMRVVYEFNEVA